MVPKFIDANYVDGPKIIALLLSKDMPVQHFLLTSSTLLDTINFPNPNQKNLRITSINVKIYGFISEETYFIYSINSGVVGSLFTLLSLSNTDFNPLSLITISGCPI